MNNSKTSILTWFFIGCGMFSWSQVTSEDSALELVKLLHKNKIEQILLSQPEAMIDSASVNLNNEENKELYNNISQKYKERFKPNELKELTAFYTSPIGNKLLKEYPLIMADANTLISKWEMKQLGIEDISIDEDSVLFDENELTLEVIDTIVPKPKVKPFKKDVIIVKTIQQLQTLLKNDPNLLYDPVELSKILNISHEPETIDDPESIIDPEIKNNNPIKN